MTTIFTTTPTRGPLKAEVHGNNGLIFSDRTGHGGAHIAGLPEGVAQATADAFNRAMQAVPDGKGGFIYQGRCGDWHIGQIATGHKLYQFQHDDAEDGSPFWMHGGPERSIEAAMDAIDDLEDEHGCQSCNALAEELIEFQGSYICDDCAEKESRHRAEMAEMAGDDRAHAAMDKARGL